MRNARPCARGRIRFSVGPSSTNAALTTRAAGSSCRLCSALATALATTLATGSPPPHLGDGSAGVLRGEPQQRQCLVGRQVADEVHPPPRLHGGHADEPGGCPGG